MKRPPTRCMRRSSCRRCSIGTGRRARFRSFPMCWPPAISQGAARQPVGASGAVNLFGTVDMAGNVKEWCANATRQAAGSFSAVLRRCTLAVPRSGRAIAVRAASGLRPASHRAVGAARREDDGGHRDRRTRPGDAQAGRRRRVSGVRAAVRLRPHTTRCVAEGARTHRSGVAKRCPSWRPTARSGCRVYVFVPASRSRRSRRSCSTRARTRTYKFQPESLRCSGPTSSCAAAVCWCIPCTRHVRAPHFRSPRPRVLRDLTIQRGKDLRRTVDYLESRSDIDASKDRVLRREPRRAARAGVARHRAAFQDGRAAGRRLRNLVIPPEIEPMNYTPHVRCRC